MSALIADHMRAAASRRPGDRIGPFTAGIDSHSDDPMRNFAVPDSGACPTAAEAEQLVALSAQLARAAHGRGIGVVFLEAEPEEESIYRRTGFTDVTTKIWLRGRL
jgi:hypothetical protein